MIFYILIFIAGAIIASIGAYLIYTASFKQQNKISDEKFIQQSLVLTALQDEKKILYEQNTDLLSRAIKAESKIENAEEKLSTQKKDLEKIGESFRFAFRDLAQNILEEKTQKFTEINEEKMKALIGPLKMDIGSFKQKVEETYDKESKERFSLGKEVERLIIMTQQVSAEANNLTTALKGNSKMQGNWGEMILESLLENSGLMKGREYFLQEFIRDNAGNIIKDEHGHGLQPDVTICYPDQRKIIIDSKVSLVAWDAYIASEDKEEQQRFLLQHIRSLRLHIDGLSVKNYPTYARALDYVLLFIPIEPAFMEAVKKDGLLWKYAYDKKILLVSPTNLFAVLKIIADLWKVELQNKNAIDIAEKAGLLYDKFALFLDNFELIGKKISDANIVYESAFKQLSTGRGNVISKIEELKKMGASASRQLPNRLLPGEE